MRVVTAVRAAALAVQALLSLATCALFFQVVVAAAAVFGGARWLTPRGGISPTWIEASAVLLTSAIVVALTTVPRPRRPPPLVVDRLSHIGTVGVPKPGTAVIRSLPPTSAEGAG